MLQACNANNQQLILAFLGGCIFAHTVLRLGLPWRRRQEQSEYGAGRKKSVSEELGRLIKRGSLWLSGANRTDFLEREGSPQTTIKKSAFAVEQKPLPHVYIKGGSDSPYYPVSAFVEASTKASGSGSLKAGSSGGLRAGSSGGLGLPLGPLLEETLGGVTGASNLQRTSAKPAIARSLSGIPTDINVPDLVFGRHIRGADSAMESIVPFCEYAPCRILDVSPDGKENSRLFEALKKIASSYLRADNSEIADCIQRFGLNDLLYGVARLELKLKPPLQTGWQSSGMKPNIPAKRQLSAHAMQRAAEEVVRNLEGPHLKCLEEKEAVRSVVSSFMHEIECILHEYLSFNWDRAEEIYSANSAGHGSGLSRPHSERLLTMPNIGSALDIKGSRSQGAGSASLSPHPSGWSDILNQQPGSPSSVTDSIHSTLESFDEYLANLPLNGSFSSPKLTGLENLPRDKGQKEAEQGQRISHDTYQTGAAQGLPGGFGRGQNGATSGLAGDSPETSPQGHSPLGISDDDELLYHQPRPRLSHEDFFGRHPKRRMSLAASSPALSSQAHQKSHRTVRKQQLSTSEGTETEPTSEEEATVKFAENDAVVRRRALRNWRRARYAARQNVTRDMLGHHRRFQTLKQMFRELEHAPPVNTQSQRQPVILLLGGGMAAGKSTVREIISRDGFWSKVGKDAVVVEADAIKNRDQLFASMSRANLVDMLDVDNELRQHLHEYSTKAAEILLVAALNQQKDIVFDGTMTWAPFVQQTIAMVRDHQHNYKRGCGFFVDSQGNGYEKYWEVDEDSSIDTSKKVPYRIELVGVTCDPGLAVARGIWRKIRTGRSVPVAAQLRSHRLFSENFEAFTSLVDCATLYDTGAALTTFNKGGMDLSPQVIAHRSSYTRGELLINPAAYQFFQNKSNIDDQAICRGQLYASCQSEMGTIPISHEDTESALRHVFRAADKKQRRERMGRNSHSVDLSSALASVC